MVPGEIPSEDLFGVKMATTAGAAASQKSVATGISGYQEEGYDEMMDLGEEVTGRKKGTTDKKEERPKDQRVTI